MPQTRSKNSWKNNPRLKPPENLPKTNSANAKLKNIVIEEEALTETQEIIRSKIKRRASYDWEILEAKEEANKLKLEAENLIKISGQCVKIVTDDRPRPTIIFRRPASMVEESVTFQFDSDDQGIGRSKSFYSNQLPKYNFEGKPSGIKTTGDKLFTNLISEKEKAFQEQITKVSEEESVLTQYNATKFMPRRVQSAKSFEPRWRRLYENQNPSDLTIDRRRGLYRPFTAGGYSKVAERQARTKSQLSIILNNRFPPDAHKRQKQALLKDCSQNDVNLQKRVKTFCNDIEYFKKQVYLDSENFVGANEEVLYNNNLEKLLRKLNVF